jgi:hypothetical protein
VVAPPINYGVADDTGKYADDGGAWFDSMLKGANLTEVRWTLAFDGNATTINELPFIVRAAPQAQKDGVHVVLGAADIGLRHPGLFGTIESWGGYFHPLHDGPFKDADKATLRSHDPTVLARTEAGMLRRDRTRFFLSTGPNHSRWFKSTQTIRFRSELEHFGLDTAGFNDPDAKGEWRAQLQRGLGWALAPRAAR